MNVTVLPDNEIQVDGTEGPCANSSDVRVNGTEHLWCCSPSKYGGNDNTTVPLYNVTAEPDLNYTVRETATCNHNLSWTGQELSCDQLEITPSAKNLSLNWPVSCNSLFNNISATPVNRSQLVVGAVDVCEGKAIVNGLDPFTEYNVKLTSDEKNCSMNATTLPAAPSTPTHFSVTKPAFNTTTNQSRIATVTWNAPHHVNGVLKQYTLSFHYENSAPQNKIIPAKQCPQKCTDEYLVKPESRYNFSITAENEVPAGEQSDTVTFTLITEAGIPFFYIPNPLSNNEDEVKHNSVTLLLNGSSISNDNGRVIKCEVKMQPVCEDEKDGDSIYSQQVYCTKSLHLLDTQEFPIVIGEESPTISDCMNDNLNLEAQQCYAFTLIIHTENHFTRSNTVYIRTKANPILQALYGLLGLVSFLLVGLIVAYVIYSRRYKLISYLPHFKIRRSSIELPMVVPCPPDGSVERRILLSDLQSTVERLLLDGGAALSAEYAEIKSQNTSKPCMNAILPANKAKTRYLNILPYDETRVVLKDHPNVSGSDFINASYIHGYSVAREFIACQGPLSNTVSDFWRMVWEKNIHVIVMVTQCVERGKEKCCKYWPDVCRSFSFGDITLRLKNLQEQEYLQDGYIQRTLQLSKRHKVRYIHQFHFVSWPDMGCPATPNQLINFVKAVKICVPAENSHVVVHCSAGVGRTGTFIGLSNLMEEMREQDSIDVFHTVYRMRLHRTNMVQTEVQYSFLYKCVLKYYLDQKGQSQSWPAIEEKLNNMKAIPDIINGALRGPQNAMIIGMSIPCTTISEEEESESEGEEN